MKCLFYLFVFVCGELSENYLFVLPIFVVCEEVAENHLFVLPVFVVCGKVAGLECSFYLCFPMTVKRCLK